MMSAKFLNLNSYTILKNSSVLLNCSISIKDTDKSSFTKIGNIEKYPSVDIYYIGEIDLNWKFPMYRSVL